jgi:hypothetical protein
MIPGRLPIVAMRDLSTKFSPWAGGFSTIAGITGVLLIGKNGPINA